MGLFDKLKNAVNAVTGGAAKVTLDYTPTFVYPGDKVEVRVTATSTGGEVKSAGVFIDLYGHEEVRVRNTTTTTSSSSSVSSSPTSTQVSTTLDQKFQIAPEFTLGANETQTFQGSFVVPPGLHPTYTGPQAKHTWQIRGRVEAWGNDPDSGYQPLRIGYRE